MAKTPSKKPASAPKKRSLTKTEPKKTQKTARQTSLQEADKAEGNRYHLGNLVLRPGDTYVTDATAAGMCAVGRGGDFEYAIVHKVPPTACSQFALIVDWVFV